MSNNGGVRIYLRECIIANNNSAIQDYVHLDTKSTYEMTPGSKPFSVLCYCP